MKRETFRTFLRDPEAAACVAEEQVAAFELDPLAVGTNLCATESTDPRTITGIQV